MLQDGATEKCVDTNSVAYKTQTRLLAVDDDSSIVQVIREIATSQGFAVRAVTQSREFRAAYSEFPPDVIVLDLLMPDMDGFEVLTLLRNLRCRAQIILLSGVAENYLHMAHEFASAGGLNIGGVLAKPTQIGQLYQLLSQ